MAQQTVTTLEELRYPIGPFQHPSVLDGTRRTGWIDEIAALPRKLRTAVFGLSEEQLETPYRPGGWTVRQVVHHLPDSHLNSYIRFKLALTEDSPSINAYNEAAWADMKDAKSAPIDLSLNLLDSLHARWVMCLRAMREEDFARTFRHPERGVMRLDGALALYAWHSQHHFAQINGLLAREGWLRA